MTDRAEIIVKLEGVMFMMSLVLVHRQIYPYLHSDVRHDKSKSNYKSASGHWIKQKITQDWFVIPTVLGEEIWSPFLPQRSLGEGIFSIK